MVHCGRTSSKLTERSYHEKRKSIEVVWIVGVVRSPARRRDVVWRCTINQVFVVVQ